MSSFVPSFELTEKEKDAAAAASFNMSAASVDVVDGVNMFGRVDADTLAGLKFDNMNDHDDRMKSLACGKKCQCLLHFANQDNEEYLCVVATVKMLGEQGTAATSASAIPARSRRPYVKAGEAGMSTASVSSVTKSSSSSSSSSSTSSVPSSTVSNRGTRSVEHDTFNIQLARKLRDRGFCWKGIEILTNTSKNYWNHIPTNVAHARSRVQQIQDMNTANEAAIQDDNVDLEDQDEQTTEVRVPPQDVGSTHCCSRHCLARLSPKFITLLRQKWDCTGVGSQRRRQQCTAKLAWDDLEDRRSDYCYESIHVVLGASKNLVQRVVRMCLAGGYGSGSIQRLDHGLVAYRKDISPSNLILKEDVVAVITDIIDENFRPDPVQGNNLYALSEDMSTVGQLHQELIKRMPDDWCGCAETTMRRGLEDYRKLHGVKLFSMTVGHQLCPSCKLFDMCKRFLALSMNPLLQKRRELAAVSNCAWFSPASQSKMPAITVAQPFASALFIDGGCTWLNLRVKPTQQQLYSCGGWFAVFAAEINSPQQQDSWLSDPEILLGTGCFSELWSTAPETDSLPSNVFLGAIHVSEVKSRLEINGENDWVGQRDEEDDGSGSGSGGGSNGAAANAAPSSWWCLKVDDFCKLSPPIAPEIPRLSDTATLWSCENETRIVLHGLKHDKVRT